MKKQELYDSLGKTVECLAGTGILIQAAFHDKGVITGWVKLPDGSVSVVDGESIKPV